jgi:hypothetical protein
VNGLDIEEFEKWVYQSEEIQAILSNEDYLELNFNEGMWIS